MTTCVDVLDHGFVRLVDYMGDDLSVVRAARVSYDAAWRAGVDEKSDEKLINYLWKHKHTTPFETVVFTFEVKLPIFVWRQWVRHRTWDKLSVNELSARYKELPEEYYVPKLEHIGGQSKSNKQGRTFDVKVDEIVPNIIDQLCGNAFREYKWLLEKGVPRELARIVLPLATYTHMFATVNLLNLLKFLTLRSDIHAQYEIRVYADAMKELIRPIVPVCLMAWETNP